mgnify:CR=1 FL=1
MNTITAAITAVGAYVPDFVLTNKALETIVDTNDEWITSRTGIKERRILKDEDKGTSFLAIKAAQDLLAKTNGGKIPKGNSVKALDIGIGANCIYPIIGASVYGWDFVGSDIDETSLASVENIINSNESLKGKITVKLQKNQKNIFSF